MSRFRELILHLSSLLNMYAEVSYFQLLHIVCKRCVKFQLHKWNVIKKVIYFNFVLFLFFS